MSKDNCWRARTKDRDGTIRYPRQEKTMEQGAAVQAAAVKPLLAGSRG